VSSSASGLVTELVEVLPASVYLSLKEETRASSLGTDKEGLAEMQGFCRFAYSHVEAPLAPANHKTPPPLQRELVARANQQ